VLDNTNVRTSGEDTSISLLTLSPAAALSSQTLTRNAGYENVGSEARYKISLNAMPKIPNYSYMEIILPAGDQFIPAPTFAGTNC